MNFDDSEYYCENCDVRFTRYVFNGNGEIDLISALNQISKDSVKVADESLTEIGTEINYFVNSYIFVRSAKDWSLTDIQETEKEWDDVDPNIVSDEIQLLRNKIDADFYFMNE